MAEYLIKFYDNIPIYAEDSEDIFAIREVPN